VGVGEIHAGRRDLVELLTRARLLLGKLDDVQDLGAAEAGDLHGTHEHEAKACPEQPVRSDVGSRQPRVEVAAVRVCASITKVARDDTS
jgi:hypothetical protein